MYETIIPEAFRVWCFLISSWRIDWKWKVIVGQHCLPFDEIFANGSLGFTRDLVCSSMYPNLVKKLTIL